MRSWIDRLRSWGPFFKGVLGAIVALIVAGVLYGVVAVGYHVIIDHRDHHVLVNIEIQRQRAAQPK